jgi:hypothetical protein
MYSNNLICKCLITILIMNNNKNTFLYSDLFVSTFLSLIFFLSTWIYPLVNNNLHFNTHFVIFFQDIQYFSIVKNFFSFNFSELPLFSTNKTIILPITSLFLHSLFYKIFNIYSFPIVEFILNFIFFLLLIKLFRCTFKKNYFSNLFLFLILYELLYLIFLLDLFGGYLNSGYQILNSFLGDRFPRPLITKILIVSYLLIAINFLNNKNNKNIYIYFVLVLLITIFQYPYLFFYQIISLFLIYILNYREYRFHINQKIISLILLMFGLMAFFYMTSLVEEDYFIRVGQYSLDKNKIDIFYKNIFYKIFYYKNFIFLFALIITYFFLRKTKNINIYLFKILNFLIISGFIVIILYPVFFSEKIVSYHKFFDLLYLFISLYVVFGFLKLFESILSHYGLLLKKNNIFFIFGLILMIIFNSFLLKIQNQDVLKSEKTVDLNNLVKYLDTKKNDLIFLESCLYTNSEHLYTIWKIYHNFACTSDGFVNSLTNSQIFSIFYERSKKFL